VYQGVLSEPKEDVSSGDTVRRADFSAVTTPGTYVVSVDGLGSSYKFKIADDIYNIPLVHTLRSYTMSRANIAMDDPITGFKHGPDHMKAQAAKVMFTDGVSTKGSTLDVTGGWWDAGDYGKYVITGAVTTAQILLAYEAQPEKINNVQLFFPECLAQEPIAMPDTLAEMKWELDWMLKMQRPDGAVYLKATSPYWSGLDTSPEQEDYPQYIFGLDTYNTAAFGAANALAARVYQKYDAAYAAKLLDASKKAFAYLKAHPESSRRDDPNQDRGSGAYNKLPENERKGWVETVKRDYPSVKLTGDEEERVWLAAELFKTTGDKEYEQYLKDKLGDVLVIRPTVFTWTNSLALGQFAYCTSQNADSDLQSKVKTSFLQYADKVVKDIADNGYNCSLLSTEYTWASNRVAVNKGNFLTLAYQLDPKKAYLDAALDQVHYALGRNATGYCYLTGNGSNPTRFVHNRMRVSTGVYVPGFLTGGPNNWQGGDPLQLELLALGTTPPAKLYFDITESYSTNENCIDFSASIAQLLYYFANVNGNLTPEDIKVK
jgi:endoglucanase